jgi:hypothetical protein
VTYFYLI